VIRVLPATLDRIAGGAVNHRTYFQLFHEAATNGQHVHAAQLRGHEAGRGLHDKIAYQAKPQNHHRVLRLNAGGGSPAKGTRDEGLKGTVN